jgi:hypothetical protein
MSDVDVEARRAANRAAMQAAMLKPKVQRDLPPAELKAEPAPDCLKSDEIPVPWASLARSALAADDYLVRKRDEIRSSGLPEPQYSDEFLAYTERLREIVNTGQGPLPIRPARAWK